MTKELGTKRIEEIVIELRTLQDEIIDAAKHAFDLVKEVKGEKSELDRRTWFANIEIAVSRNTTWLGSCMHTMQDVIEEIEEDIQQADDDQNDSDDDEEDEEEEDKHEQLEPSVDGEEFTTKRDSQSNENDESEEGNDGEPPPPH